MPLDTQLYRSLFPVTASSIYMNHAAVSPISRRVRDAMVGLLDDVHQSGAEHWDRWVETYDAVRRSLAQLLNAEPGEIAFAKNTSEGISTFANGLDWQPGDEVVSIEGEFPANYYAWKALEKGEPKLRALPPTAISGCWDRRGRHCCMSTARSWKGLPPRKSGGLQFAIGAISRGETFPGGTTPADTNAARSTQSGFTGWAPR
jgi:hypothetical protein